MRLDAVIWQDPHDPDMYHVGVPSEDSLGKPMMSLRMSLSWETVLDLGFDVEQLRSVGSKVPVPIELSGRFTAGSSSAKGASDAEA